MKERQRIPKRLYDACTVARICVCTAVIAAVAFCHGCTATPDGIYIDETIWIYATNRLDQTVQKHSGSATDGSVKEGGASSGAAAEPDSTSATAGNGGGGGTSAGIPPAAAVSLDYRYGGFNGNGAKEDARCRLSSPTITADTIRYKWETKAPADWARSKTESGNLVVAAAFFWDDGAKKWVGGKFEWTDESRSSRSCANIHDGYGGWNASAWRSAKRRAFCVVSADGKNRSNLLED